MYEKEFTNSSITDTCLVKEMVEESTEDRLRITARTDGL